MSLCINPSCLVAKGEVEQGRNLHCGSCGSPLLILDIYRVLKKLGEGGFGKTYLISDNDSQYVLKVLHNQTPKAIELFEQEAEVLKKLNHPGIPRVLHPSPFMYRPQGSSPPLHCLIMEYIEGESLYDYLEKRNFQPISEAAALRWLRQLVEILHLVHRANYFHRDIKPNNIMLNTDGKLVLIDFGTAREQTFTYLQKQQRQKITGIISVGYTPFEQQQGRAEPRSDFFALGRTFVFLLTGKNPGNFEDSIPQGLQWQSYAQGYAKPLRYFIDKLMQHDVNQRPANTAEILRQIKGLEKQLQPQYYVTPKTVNPTRISAPPLMGQLGEITGKITRSFVSVFWGVISGIWKLIGNILSFIFGGFVHFLKGVWSGLHAIGEALTNFIISLPWKGFILGLILYALMGYLLSPWAGAFIIVSYGFSCVLCLMTKFIVNNIIEDQFFSFLMFWVAYLPLMMGVNLLILSYDKHHQTINVKKFLFFLHFIQQIPESLAYLLFWQLLLSCFVVSISIAIFVRNLNVIQFKYTREDSFINMILRVITVALGLGIGWVISQDFTMVEYPPSIMEIWKELQQLLGT